MSKQKTLDYRVRVRLIDFNPICWTMRPPTPAQSWYPVTENERTLFSLVMQTHGTVDWAAHHSHHNLHLLIAPWFMHIKTLSSLYKSPAELMTRGWRRARSINNLPVVKKKIPGQKFLEELTPWPDDRCCWWFRQNDGVTHAANLMENVASPPGYGCGRPLLFIFAIQVLFSSFYTYTYSCVCCFCFCVCLTGLKWPTQGLVFIIDGYNRPYTQHQPYMAA